MRRTTKLFSAGLICLFASSACAEYSQSLSNRFGRWIGWGWSEGYHAYDECPACRPHLQAMRPVGVWPPAAKSGGQPTSTLHWQPLLGGSAEVLPPMPPQRSPSVEFSAPPQDAPILKPSQQMRPSRPRREPIPAPVPLPRE